MIDSNVFQFHTNKHTHLTINSHVSYPTQTNEPTSVHRSFFFSSFFGLYTSIYRPNKAHLNAWMKRENNTIAELSTCETEVLYTTLVPKEMYTDCICLTNVNHFHFNLRCENFNTILLCLGCENFTM